MGIYQRAACEYSFEAKKQFTAYIVLRITNNTTCVFQLDADLQKENINESLFQYNINEENPFSKVYKSGISETLSLSQLGLNLLNFKYACITALKRSDKIVGFLVGLKDKNLSEDDQFLLEDLAKESAA